jgi:hypothetical protein
MANQTTAYQMPDGRMALDIDTSKTLADTDCGVVQNIVADSVVITLPATVVGYNFTVRNAGVKSTGGAKGTASDGTVLVAISPNSVDKIAGATFTAADNKDALNTKATSHIGDEMSLAGDGVNGYMVTSYRGIWAREA